MEKSMNIVEKSREECVRQGYAVSEMERAIGRGNGFLNPKKISDLKMNDAIKIADFLNVSLHFLYEREKTSVAPLTRDERLLISYYSKLNAEGKKAALERMLELTEIGKYNEV